MSASKKTVEFFKKLGEKRKERRKKRDEKRGYHINWAKAVRHALVLSAHFLFRLFTYLINILITILVIGVLTALIVGFVFALYLKNNIDPVLDTELLKTEQNATTMFYYYDDNGTPVEMEDERINGGENRIWVSIQEVPDHVIKAYVAIEDHRFWDHQGVDWYRTLGAVRNFIMPSGSTFGGSTITQQLVKNLTGDDDYSIQRKIQEMFRALYLEQKLDKSEILELYLNTIYLSQGCYGLKTAAQKYFGKEVSELTLTEGAALASIVKYPTKYDPIQNPEFNQERRNTVLKTMLSYGYITQEEFNESWDQPLEIYKEPSNSSKEKNTGKKVSSDYIDAVIEDLIADFMAQRGITREVASNLVFSGGYKIYTAMDPFVQETLEKCYLDDKNFPEETFVILPQSAMVVCDPYSGDVLGIIGRRGPKTQSRILNLATQARRSPGSSIKPLSTYSPGLDLGLITWGTVVDDTPHTYGNGGYTWPKNVNKKYTGLENINYAVTVSLNTVAVKVLERVTVERSYEYLLKLGITNLVESYTNKNGVTMSDLSLAPLALGATTLGLTVREMSSAYTTFTNGGVHNKSRTYYQVVDSAGNVVLNNKPESTEVFRSDTCTIMTKMMQNVVANYAKYLTIDNWTAVAGKTGTSMYEYDRWFCGFTPYYVGAVWYGFVQPSALHSYTVNPGMFIFDKIMTELHRPMYEEAVKNGGELEQEFEQYGDIVECTICKDSGQLYDPNVCGHDPRGGRAEVGYYVNGTQPTEYCTRHVLIDFCAETEQIAGPNCENIIQYALVLETERAFPFQLEVTDAQYTFRPLGDAAPDYAPLSQFYSNTLEPKTYVGRVRKVDKYFNSYCSKHNSPDNSTGTP
ncbi:MAG: transglycosylase domain-containing protein [Clostridia bacterium]|nr:transglycosylase domain-containing protein [Clostridia bacterium]